MASTGEEKKSNAASKSGGVDQSYAKDFVQFLNSAVSPFHAVEESSKRLKAAGFQHLVETKDWDLKPNGKYFFTRNHSTLFAFVVGGQYKAGNGFNIVGAHTDSPVLRLKPKSNVENQGFVQIGVQCYGGGLWHTWFDRDLTFAGRVIVNKAGSFEHRLVHVDRPILKIPNLAIHLDRTVSEGFKFNNQTHLLPVIATSVKAQLEGREGKEKGPHSSVLLNLLASELGCQSSEIADFELCLVDSQKSAIGGLYNEFVFSGRLDNLCSSYCALTAIIESAGSLANESRIQLVAMFDHEEIGSESQQGASSNMTEQTLHRILLASGSTTLKNAEQVALRQSFLISADMGHACHPNYPEKHEPDHRPAIHGGPVIKHNANQRYATNSVTACLLRELAKQNSIPLQEFVVRNDTACGSTIGPILSSRCGIRTIDIGNPQLSMHSIRETCGTDDVTHAVNLFKAFFTQFTTLDEKLVVDG